MPHRPEKTLLILGSQWPEPASSAAGSRMRQLIHFFQEEGFTIYFGSAARENAYSVCTGVEKLEIRLNDPGFSSLLLRLQPQLVLFDRFMTEEQYGWKVAETLPGALRLLDTEDLHSLRAAREAAIIKGQTFSTALWRVQELTIRELASIYRSDLSLLISEFEMGWLRKEAGVAPALLHYLPFMPDPVETASLPDFDTRTGFLSIGNGKHAPNVDGLHWLRQKIWPLIRQKLPEATISVYGAYLPGEIHALHEAAVGFLVKGRAPEATEVFRNSRLLLAPLRFGAGQKGKLVEAMSCGTPTVTTPIGAEGMQFGLPWGGAIEEQPSKFAARAVTLYQGKKKWEQAQTRGFAILKVGFDQKNAQKRLKRKLRLLIKELPAHRNRNLLGAMLLHHSMASSRYMGKWIEAKQGNT